MRLTALTLSILLGALLVSAEVKTSYSCPGAPQPLGRCDPAEGRNLCTSDRGCQGRTKCCPTFCGRKCTEPGAVKAGSCPVVNTLLPCKAPVPKTCDFDTDCEGKQKCCNDGCILRCKDPVVQTKPPKPGKCPRSPIPIMPCPTAIPAEHRECDTDHICAGKKKCCPYACQVLCKDPVE